MAAQSFKEWFDIVTDVGELDPFSGFTSKGVAHIAWDAAIKSLEGVPEQANNSTKVETLRQSCKNRSWNCLDYIKNCGGCADYEAA